MLASHCFDVYNLTGHICTHSQPLLTLSMLIYTLYMHIYVYTIDYSGHILHSIHSAYIAYIETERQRGTYTNEPTYSLKHMDYESIIINCANFNNKIN